MCSSDLCVTVLISDPYFRRANAEKSEKNIEGYSEVFLFMLTATLWPMIAFYVVGGWFGQKMNETDAADADADDDDDHGPGGGTPS